MPIKIRGAVNKKSMPRFKEWINQQGYIEMPTQLPIEYMRFMHLLTLHAVVFYNMRGEEHHVGYIEDVHRTIKEYQRAITGLPS